MLAASCEPAAPSRQSTWEWEEVEEAMEKMGVTQVAQAIAALQSRDPQASAPDALAACRLFAAHRSKFRSAGALKFWCETGVWPVPIDGPTRPQAW